LEKRGVRFEFRCFSVAWFWKFLCWFKEKVWAESFISRMLSESATTRQQICCMIARNRYQEFPGPGTVLQLERWLRHYEGLAIEAAQHGRGMVSKATLDAKAAEHKLLSRALGALIVRPEELTDALAAESFQPIPQSPALACWQCLRRCVSRSYRSF
jgi:hypothetical protein